MPPVGVITGAVTVPVTVNANDATALSSPWSSQSQITPHRIGGCLRGRGRAQREGPLVEGSNSFSRRTSVERIAHRGAGRGRKRKRRMPVRRLQAGYAISPGDAYGWRGYRSGNRVRRRGNAAVGPIGKVRNRFYGRRWSRYRDRAAIQRAIASAGRRPVRRIVDTRSRSGVA